MFSIFTRKTRNFDFDPTLPKTEAEFEKSEKLIFRYSPKDATAKKESKSLHNWSSYEKNKKYTTFRI